MTGRRLHRIVAGAVAGAMIASCGITGLHGNGDDNYYSAFVNFRGQEWLYSAPAVMIVDTLRDSVARSGTLVLSLRHSDAYEYSNIWLELSRPVNDTVVRRDTFNLLLADDFGRWYGRGSGPSLQLTDTLYTDFTLRRGDTLTLRHIMRVDTLANIEQAGIVYYPKE